MDMRASPPPANPIRACRTCTRGGDVCNGEVVAVTTSPAREAFVRCAPLTGTASSAEQAAKCYDCLPRIMSEHGFSMSQIVLERVFFRDVQADFELLGQIRRDAYRRFGVQGDALPAASYVEQPPCRPEQAFEMQLYAVAPNGNAPVRVQSFPASEQGAMAKLVEINGYRHLYVTNIQGRSLSRDPRVAFREQSDSMFETAAELLRRHGAVFPQVLRTWCYLDNIDRDYDAFNASRNAFFAQHQVQRLPASTGIRSGLYPHGTLCAMDLYALLNPENAVAEVMHTPTLNEANEYGSSFSRGMKLVLPEKTVLFISGTASVDERGETVHIDDVRRQVDRMLLNIRELFRPHGASFADVVQVITYLKWRDELDLFLKVWEEWGLAGLPNTLVEAGVCRPNLLCEMEAIAIRPS